MAKSKKIAKIPSSKKKFLPLLVVGLVAVVGVYMLVQSRAATGCVASPIEAKGSSGNCVRYIQTLANHKLPVLGCRSLAVHGSFTSSTHNGVICIQRAWGLTQHGKVGTGTWRALCSTETKPGKGGPFTSAEASAARSAGCSTL